MALGGVEKKKFTYEDYLKTPDDVRYELIEGELNMTPAPTPNHQRISRKLEFILDKFVTENDFGEVFDAPCDVHFDNENVLEPDILFISKERAHIIGERNIQGAPDLVIEIVSENSAYGDLIQKKKLYARFGVKEYWVVVPAEGYVETYILKDSSLILQKTYGKNDVLEAVVLAGLKIDLKKIF